MPATFRKLPALPICATGIPVSPFLRSFFSEYRVTKKLGLLLESQFELPGSNRIAPMEGMRGFAALLVFFVHFNSLFGEHFGNICALKMIRFMASIGHVGVDLFFVLSGFLIYGIVLRRQFHFFSYVLRRIQRLYPVFVAVLAIYLILSCLFPEQSKLPVGFVSTIPYVVANLAMLPGMTQITPIITVAWSLSYEWFFYLILPVLIAGFGMRHWPYRWRIIFFMAMAAIYWVVCTLGAGRHPRLILFASGILLCELCENNAIFKKLPKLGEPVAVMSFLAVLAAIGMSKINSGNVELILSHIPYFYVPLLAVTLFFLVCYGLFFHGWVRSFFSWTPLRWVGNMSYSYYLIHGLTLQGLSFLFNTFAGYRLNSPMLFIVLLGSILATLISAGALFLTIERPISIQRTGSIISVIRLTRIEERKAELHG